MESFDRQERRCCSCSTSARCLVLVAVFNILVFAVMATALVTRFVIYQDISFIDMPTDMRVVNRQESSAFCNSHVISTSLQHHTGEGEIINTLPQFDMFLFDADPRDPESSNVSRVHVAEKLIGDRRMKPGTYSYHAFNFLRDSVANISLCSQALTADNHVLMPMIRATAVRGWSDFDIIKERLETSDSSPCQPPVDCLYHHLYEVTNCDTDWVSVELKANVSDQYIFIFSYPRILENASFTQPDIKLGTRYHLNRTQYDLTKLEPETKDEDVSGSIEPNKYILLNFKYRLNEPEGSLYNIEVQFKCDPNILVYVGVFFLGSLLLIAVVAIVACVWSRASGHPRYVSLSYGDQDPAVGTAGNISGHDNSGSRSYGSTLVH